MDTLSMNFFSSAAVAIAVAFAATAPQEAQATDLYSNPSATDPFIPQNGMIGEVFQSSDFLSAGSSIGISFDVQAIGGSQAQIAAMILPFNHITFFGADFNTLLPDAVLASAQVDVTSGHVHLTATPTLANNAILKNEWIALVIQTTSTDGTQLSFRTSGYNPSHPDNFMIYGDIGIPGADAEDHSISLGAIVSTSPVPEPSDYAMLLGGLAVLVGTSTLRRRKTQVQ